MGSVFKIRRSLLIMKRRILILLIMVVFHGCDYSLLVRILRNPRGSLLTHTIRWYLKQSGGAFHKHQSG